MRGAGISTSYNTRVTEDLGLLDSLDELTIVSPTTSPQRPARRPRTPLARNTIGSRFTMSPPRPNTAVASRYGVSPHGPGHHPGLYGLSPPGPGHHPGLFGVSPPGLHPGLTSHFSHTATPPRSHHVLDMTIDLTDSPFSTPFSP